MKAELRMWVKIRFLITSNLTIDLISDENISEN
jgi:hypothetical protein